MDTVDGNDLPDLIDDDSSDDGENSFAPVPQLICSIDDNSTDVQSVAPEVPNSTLLRRAIHSMVETFFAKTEPFVPVHRLWSITRRWFLFPLLQWMLLIEGDKWLTWEITKIIYFRYRRFRHMGHINEEIDGKFCLGRFDYLSLSMRELGLPNKLRNYSFDRYDYIAFYMRELGLPNKHRKTVGMYTFKYLATHLWKIYYQGTITGFLRTKSWWVAVLFKPFIKVFVTGGKDVHQKTNGDFDKWACSLNQAPLRKVDYDKWVNESKQMKHIKYLDLHDDLSDFF